MRDPLGTIHILESRIVRDIYEGIPQSHYLRSEHARTLVAQGKLIDFRFEGDLNIISPAVPFVTYPYEWCNAQLYDAADLTLGISEEIFPLQYELKDASAWNVIFHGCKPTFCDHLSFQVIKRREWWAFGQFIRHFVLPLCVAKLRGLNSHNAFKLDRDGLAPNVARNLLAARRFLTRWWPLMMTWDSKSSGDPKTSASHANPVHKNLYATTRWMLKGLEQVDGAQSIWSDYTHDRQHYSTHASTLKTTFVEKCINDIRPKWVVDLGCNTGEFSYLAADAGAQVIAIDLDHDCVQRLYQGAGNRTIYPVIANLDDLIGGKGWAGKEFPGLLERLDQQADIVMMLAFIHHLAISSAIPYSEIASLAAMIAKQYLIIELIDHADPLVQCLAKQRNRPATDFSIDRQISAFDKLFSVVEHVTLMDTSRHLMLLKKK